MKDVKVKFKDKEIWSVAIMVLIFALILLAFSLVQISPISFKNFGQVCQKFSYEECMAVFWQQKQYYETLTYVSVGLIVVSVGVVIFSRIQKKNKQK